MSTPKTSVSTSRRLSFEFFPPKTEAGHEKLKDVRAQLQTLSPDFFSVTYGAGGSTRDNTLSVVQKMKQEGLDVAPHLSFGGDSTGSMQDLLKRYIEIGVNRIVALRGDMPSGTGGAQQMVYAKELVSFIREHYGDHFQLEVAAYPEIHPEADSYDDDIRHLKAKLDAGANSAITQYFFNADAYFHFVDRCQQAGITQPIYPGIMPITNYKRLARFSEACGAEIPRWISKRLEGYGDDLASISAFGQEVITQMCERLLTNGVPGIHFYTMNQAEPITAIVRNLGLDKEA
ncbi:MAG: methylenetetrahydrofolate reductase [NAD(P)H] [Alteromonadaceae bacterium]|nr:MAG: methylenetetrahydrofolate reductase [NAD(P)H] [Alteromonadaceae bacterium]